MFKGRTTEKCMVGVIFAVLLTASCTWVELDDAAENVMLINANRAAQCQRLGATVATSREKIAMINRKDEKVARELLTLGKNSAADMGGNAIVEDGSMEEGKQKFGVYKC